MVEATRTWLDGGLDLSLEELVASSTRLALAAAEIFPAPA
jgi:hypothetical protein